MKYFQDIEVIGEYDVVVSGGGASGVIAALSAKKEGASVLVIERAGAVGGNLTIGHVGPTMGKYMKNTAADRINKTILRPDGYMVQDFEKAKVMLTELLDKYGVDVFLNTSLADVVKEDEKITYAVITTQSGLKAVKGKIFIDATGDGVLSYLAGEEIQYGRDDGLVQPLSVMFTIKGVDPEQKIICEHEEMDTPLKKGNYLDLCKKASLNGELPETVNIVRLYRCSAPDERMVNATQVNKLNPLLPCEYSKAQIALRKQMAQVVAFLKNNVEGFENISIKDSSDIVGVRESRRVMGQYLLTAEDLLESKTFEDVIVHNACFSIDIHNPNGAGQAESDKRPVRVKRYDIPYGAIVPKKTENLYLAGRCISGTHRAHASYRVMNIAINIGEAAGIGAALCVKENTIPKKLDYKKVQNVLSQRGIDLFAEGGEFL